VSSLYAIDLVGNFFRELQSIWWSRKVSARY
jgi:hypothetical protein